MKAIQENDGYIVVETIGSFIPFVLLVVSILSLVNIVTVQVNIHYAMTQTALTLSLHTFTQEAGKQSETFQNTINGVYTGISKLTDAETGINAAQIISAVTPEELFYKYLSSSFAPADEYLKKQRVTSFEFTDCVIGGISGDIRLTAGYEIEYTFGSLRLPFTPTLHITHSVATKAWPAGSGERYIG